MIPLGGLVPATLNVIGEPAGRMQHVLPVRSDGLLHGPGLDPATVRFAPPERGLGGEALELPAEALQRGLDQLERALARQGRPPLTVSSLLLHWALCLFCVLVSPVGDKSYPTPLPLTRQYSPCLHPLWHGNTKQLKTILHGAYKCSCKNKLVCFV